MATARARKTTPTTYDPDRRYAVTLARSVEHEGFTFRPGADTTVMTGALITSIVAAKGDEWFAEATDLPDEAEHPVAPASTHEAAEG